MTPAKDSGSKRKRGEESPSHTPPTTLPATQSEYKKEKGKKRSTGSSEVASSIAEAIGQLAHVFNAPSESILGKAVAVVEDEEELSDDEMDKVIEMFTQDGKVAEVFISLKKGAYRSKWLSRAVSERYF